MVDPNTRQGKRTPVTLKIKFKSETIEQFIERYAVDVSQGGIFIRTKEPLAVGTQMRFEFQLRDASPLIGGEGTVVWTRENDPSRPAIAPGMGVRFDRLAEGSQDVLERILSEKAKQAPQRPTADSTKPPMFTDTPTRVAPLPVQEALLGNEQQQRKRNDSFSGEQGTPLPRPVPFHSDADEFPEEAFEEATKVRALDELIAQTADAGADAKRGRVDATLTDPPRAETAPTNVDKRPYVDRDSAPNLPTPPESRVPRVLDTTPSARMEAAPAADSSNKTRLGMEPASASPKTGPISVAKIPVKEAPKAAAKDAPKTAAKDAAAAKDAPKTAAKDAATKAATKDPVRHPSAPAARSSMAPVIILLLLLVAAGGAAVWFFVLREKATETGTVASAGSGSATGSGSAGSAIAMGSGSDSMTGSGSDSMGGSGSDAMAGSGSDAMAGSGSDAMAGSGSDSMAGSGSDAMAGSGSAVANTNTNTNTKPVDATVDMVISSAASKSTIEVLGTSFAGPAPLRAKLIRGKVYTARVRAPGYVGAEITFKGGERPMARLAAKPRSIAITSEPAGALIFIDNANSGFTTPHTYELTKSQAAKRAVRLTLRKNGHKTFERMIDLSAYTEDDSRLTARIDERLPVQIIVSRPPPTNPGSAGSGTTAGSGSATTPPPTGSGTTSSLKDGPKDVPEPEPDFVNKLP